MRQIIIAAILALATAAPANAVDFLGVELCADLVDTGVILPAESPLSLESVDLGRHGGLVLLLHSKKEKVLDQVDDLMFPFIGSNGIGDDGKLEWTGDEIIAFAQVIKKGYVALAVTATCNIDLGADEFELSGRLKHAAAEDGWVDVMGVVVNNSGEPYTVASFDLSLYNELGEMICVDTILVNQLKVGQERAFRSAIRCADYAADEVASWKLQFAGGN